LAKLIEIITPQPDDTASVGRLRDRGIDNRGVIDPLMALAAAVGDPGHGPGVLEMFSTPAAAMVGGSRRDVDSGR